MALKFADTAKPMGLFPVAEAEDVELTKKDSTKKSLQAMYDDGELGGNGLPLPIQKDLYLKSSLAGSGDLIWTQRNISELYGVEKVETYPENQMNKNKVFVIENDNPIVIIDPTITTFEELGNLLSGFSGLTIEKVEDPYTSIAYKLTYDSSKSIDVNSGPSTTTGIKCISIKSEGSKKSVAWNGVTEYCGVSYSGIVTLILKGFTAEHTDKVKVFANNVELVTKEYAKTHGGSGGGALSMTKAEWEALDPKPADGTQIIITDDAGEKIITQNFAGTFYIGGYVTSSGKEINFSIPLGIKEKIKSCVCNALKVQVRQNGNYLLGAATGADNVVTIVPSGFWPQEGGVIGVRYSHPEAFPNVVNNDSIGVYCRYDVTVTYENEVAGVVNEDGGIENFLFYHNGEQISWTNPIKCIVEGHVTGDTQYIEFCIPLDKRLRAGQTVTINGLKTNIRQNGKYLVNSYVSGGYDILSNMSVYTCVNGGHFLYVELRTKSGTVPNATNNMECSVQIEAIQMEVKG